MQDDPFFNLFDIASISLIVTVLSFLLWCLSNENWPFKEVVAPFVVFVVALYFAKKGGK